jgi:hypothetical protein
MAIDFPNSPTTNQQFTSGDKTWTYDGEKWVLSTPVVASVLNDLSDVTVPTPSTGQYLAWNGSAWVNSGIVMADISDGQAISTSSSPSFAGLTSTGTLTIQQIREKVVDSTISSNVLTINYSNGTIYYQATAPSANFTVSLANLPTDNGYALTISIFVTQGATGYIPNALQIAGGFGLTIKWAGGTAPTPTSGAGKIDLFTFTLIRRGSPSGWTVLGSANLNY